MKGGDPSKPAPCTPLMALHWLDLHPQSIVEKLGGDVVHIGTAINPRSLQALAPTGGHGIEGVRGQARTDLRQAGKDFSKTGIPACHSGAAPRIKNEALVQGPLLRGILNLPPPAGRGAGTAPRVWRAYRPLQRFL